jgi:hypothetical protein
VISVTVVGWRLLIERLADTMPIVLVEALFAIEAAVTVADDAGLGHEESVARSNAAAIRNDLSLPGASRHEDAVLAVARRRGDRTSENHVLTNINVGRFNTGRWDEMEKVDAGPEDSTYGTFYC